jgi:hypothetical protein
MASSSSSNISSDLSLGDTVLVSKKHRATVRFIGPTNFAEGIWYGLELEKEIGKSLFFFVYVLLLSFNYMC